MPSRYRCASLFSNSFLVLLCLMLVVACPTYAHGARWWFCSTTPAYSLNPGPRTVYFSVVFSGPDWTNPGAYHSEEMAHRNEFGQWLEVQGYGYGSIYCQAEDTRGKAVEKKTDQEALDTSLKYTIKEVAWPN